MKTDLANTRRLAQHIFGSMIATAALSGAVQASTFTTNIELHSLDGSLTPGGYATLNSPLSRSLANTKNPKLYGNAAVDLGVLRTSASAPAWDGTQVSPYNYYQAKATASYIDTLTFTRPGGGRVPVSFTFAFDGHVQDPNAGASNRAAVTLGMTLMGPTASIVSPSVRDQYFLDGLADSYYDNFLQFSSCRTGQPQYGQAPLICHQTSNFRFSSSGDKTGTATFNFNVLSGQPIKIDTFMRAFGYSDPYIATPVSYDFSHTATLSSISTLFPDTQISSALVGQLPTVNGGVTYASAVAATVPEPSAALLLLAGIGAIGSFALCQRRAKA